MSRTRLPLRPVLALATAAAVAGGALVVTAGSTASAATGDQTFAAPVIVDNDDANSVAEPSIEVGPDGAIYVSGPQGLGGARAPALIPGTGVVPGAGGDVIWRSDDGGKTFTFLGSYDGTLGGGDSDVVAAPNGTLFASGLYAACIAVASSTDRGDSWVSNPAACTDGGGFADRQWNDVDGNDAVWTGYGTLSQGLVMQKSVATSPTVVNGPATVVNGGDYQWPGVVDVNPVNGNAVMAWNTSGSSTVADQIQINGVKRAGGLIFPSTKRVATAAGDTFDSFVSIDHGKDGTLYAAWSERRPALKETWTMLAASRDGGTTWSPPTQVDATPRTTVFPWVTAGDAGRVAVTYYGTDSTGPSAEALDDKDADWHVWSAFSTNFGATFAEHRTTQSALHRGSVCTSGLSCPTGTRDLLDFFETDLDGQGCLLTVYADNSRDVVTADGSRTADEVTRIAVIRQTGGEGLRADRSCTPAALATSSPSPTGTASPSPTGTTSPSPTATGSPSASSSASASASASASSTPTATPTPTPTASATSPSPTASAASSSAAPVASCAPTPTDVRINTPVINATGLASVTVTGARPGAPVELQGYSQNHYGTNSFANDPTKVDRSGVADDRGSITFNDLRPASNTRVQARQAGCAFGPSAVIEVRATETLTARRTGTRAYLVAGSSVPARPGGLLVSLFRITGASCRAGVEPRNCPGEVFLGQGRASETTGDYTIPVRFPARDSHVRDEFVVKTGRDAQNAPGRSNVRSLLIY